VACFVTLVIIVMQFVTYANPNAIKQQRT